MDALCKTILGLVKKGHVRYTDIKKKAVATCLRFATSNTVRKQFYHYLLSNDYVERVSRGVLQNHTKRRKTLRDPKLEPSYKRTLPTQREVQIPRH